MPLFSAPWARASYVKKYIPPCLRFREYILRTLENAGSSQSVSTIPTEPVLTAAHCSIESGYPSGLWCWLRRASAGSRRPVHCWSHALNLDQSDRENTTVIRVYRAKASPISSALFVFLIPILSTGVTRVNETYPQRPHSIEHKNPPVRLRGKWVKWILRGGQNTA